MAPEKHTSKSSAKSDGSTVRYAAPALEKGLDILEALSASTDGYTLNELAQAMGRNVNEIFRMVVTLQRRGYIQADLNDRYTLTLTMLQLANRQQPIQAMLGSALPLLHEHPDSPRQSCQLVIYQGARVGIIAQVDSPVRRAFGLKVGVA